MTTKTLRTITPIAALVAAAAFACSSTNTTEPGPTGGAGGTDTTGGTTSTGGVTTGGSSTGGSSTGGSSAGTASGGIAGTASGGVAGTASGTGGATGGVSGTDAGGMATGGASGASGTAGSGGDGGNAGNGGSGAAGGGAGGSPNGGKGGTAGNGGKGGSSGNGGKGGTAGSGGSGTCQKGTTKGNEVLVIGESFIAATHEITREIERLAKANGSLMQSETYRDNAISGTTLAGGGNSIPNQYQRGVDAGPVRYVLMDGGGNDCLQANNPSGALSAAMTMFTNMQAHNTEKILYFFYPDPIGSQYNTLKSCLDTLRPQMKALCDGLTSPKCYWLDLRETWNGHPEYTMDGIHPLTAGSQATGQAIWRAMVQNCVAQ